MIARVEKECITDGYRHNSRCRYTDGFFCEDCNTFFHKDSPTYRGGELLSSIHMVIGNIKSDFIIAKSPVPQEIDGMLDKIGIGVVHENYEELIAEAELIMTKYGKTSESASVTLQ